MRKPRRKTSKETWIILALMFALTALSQYNKRQMIEQIRNETPVQQEVTR